MRAYIYGPKLHRQRVTSRKVSAQPVYKTLMDPAGAVDDVTEEPA